MTILIAAAIAAAQTAPAQPAQMNHGHHAQPMQHNGAEKDGCCCKDMANSGAKMECCAKHGKGHEGQHDKGAAHSG